MNSEPIIWLTKIILAHLLTDFVLQPSAWIEQRQQKHFAAPALYLHTIITAIIALIMIGWIYWPVALIILVTHTLIDGWKSYRPKTIVYFLTDQALHLLVILVSWYLIFMPLPQLVRLWQRVHANEQAWLLVTGFIFVTTPAGIIIGQLTNKWREKIDNGESLANAGKWIGIIERIIIFVFVLQHQFSAIGILIAAKGIIRFNEKDRAEVKTEYLVIGTLMSIVTALATGLIVLFLAEK